MSALTGPAVTSGAWPVDLNPADPGERDDAGTIWPYRVVVRRCRPKPNLFQAERDALEWHTQPILRKR